MLTRAHRTTARGAALGGSVVLAALFMALPAGAEPEQGGGPAEPKRQCTVSDKRLSELSGLATDGGQRRWAISDGGSQVRVYELGPDCAVRNVLSSPVNPYDVEDLARSPDGTFWLADTGDNQRSRSTVALIALRGRGPAVVHRLRYPDGPHDAEAVLLARDGRPLIITKEPVAPAGVYRPARALTGGAPVAMERVGEVSLPSSTTRGGPIGGIGARTVTGGATSADGTVAALRTYTDAWLFHAPDGDLVAALGREPVRVPLPGEPQGEAVAFDGSGALLSGTEARDGAPAGLRVVPGAVVLARTDPDAEPAPDAAPTDPSDRPNWLGRTLAVVAVLGFGTAGWLSWRRAG
ncbi:hypothetical protein GCM10023321_71010 [Pseudonocardia eucalypti]|uniref:Esterase-like activity of phytase family protein n=1 Tax=Pseudonocardia eucalypti TaxID=648755 RepID=A0ABP9R5P5_9PSEU|nr:hypothetical protein [Pseudonocardia eucalypti]